MKFDIFANNLGRGGESQRGKFTIEIVRGYLGRGEPYFWGSIREFLRSLDEANFGGLFP